MLLKILLIVTPFAFCSNEEVIWTEYRRLDRLTTVLNNTFTEKVIFGHDFISETLRYNFSEEVYMETCYNVYVEMKPSPLDMENLHPDFISLIQYGMNNSKPRNLKHPSDWKDIMPNLHRMLTNRTRTIYQFIANATVETKDFLSDIDWTTKLFVTEFVDDFDQETVDAKHFTAHPNIRFIVQHIAMRYRDLDDNSKRDLERSLCISNVLRWLHFDTNEVFDELLNVFWENALNIDALVKDNSFLSRKSPHEVKEIYKRRARMLVMPIQEYVDTCARTFAVMKISSEEKKHLNGSTELFMGKEWGKRTYNSSEELLNALYTDSSPFINMITRRWNFVKLHQHKTGSNISWLRKIERELLQVLVKANNRAATKETHKISLFSKDLINDLDTVHGIFASRAFEQVYCFQSTFENVMEQEMKYELHGDFGMINHDV